MRRGQKPKQECTTILFQRFNCCADSIKASICCLLFYDDDGCAQLTSYPWQYHRPTNNKSCRRRQTKFHFNSENVEENHENCSHAINFVLSSSFCTHLSSYPLRPLQFLSHSLLLTQLPYQTFICLCEWVDVRRFWVSIFIWKFFGSTYASSYSYWWWWSLNYFECVLFSCLLSLVVGKAIDKHFRAHDSPFPLPFRAHPPRCQPRSNWFMQILEGNTSSSSSSSTGVAVVVAEEISSTSRCSVELSNCRIGPTPSSRLYIVSSGFECLLVLLPIKSTGWRGHLACNSNSFGS